MTVIASGLDEYNSDLSETAFEADKMSSQNL